MFKTNPSKYNKAMQSSVYSILYTQHKNLKAPQTCTYESEKYLIHKQIYLISDAKR